LWFNNDKGQFDYLIENQAVFNNRGYFLRFGTQDNFIEYKNNEFGGNPVFEEILYYMGYLRDRGDLALITARDLLDYWDLTYNIRMDQLLWSIITTKRLKVFHWHYL